MSLDRPDDTALATVPTAKSPSIAVELDGILSGNALRAPARLSRFATILGRRNADITIDDVDVSRQHAVIERYEGRFLIKDLGSTNGTYVNGRRVDAEFLRPGDVIKVGGTQLLFEVELG